MDALRNSKKKILAVAILFLFTFFNLILDAPRTCDISYSSDASTIYSTFQALFILLESWTVPFVAFYPEIFTPGGVGEGGGGRLHE